MRASFATLLFAFFICAASSRSIPSSEYDNDLQFDADRDNSDENGLLERLQQLQNGLDGSEELEFDSESFGDDDDDEKARVTETDDEATLDSNGDVDTTNELYDNDDSEWRVDDTYDTDAEEDEDEKK